MPEMVPCENIQLHLSDDLDITDTVYVQCATYTLTNHSKPNKICVYVYRVQCAHSETKLYVLKLNAMQSDDSSVLYTSH